MHTNLSLVFVTAPILLCALLASIPYDHGTPKRKRTSRQTVQHHETLETILLTQGILT